MAREKKDWTEREKECRNFQLKVLDLGKKMKIPELYFYVYLKDLVEETEKVLKEE